MTQLRRRVSGARVAPVPSVPTTFTAEVTGSGHPVIFIPGFACGGRVWEGTVAAMTNVEAHLVTFAGFAGLPPVSEPSLSRIHSELQRYILDSGLGHAVVVGHSLGGHMALWLATTVRGLGGVIDVEGFPFLAGADDPAMTQAQAEIAVRPKVAIFREMTIDELDSWIWQNMSGMFANSDDRDRVLSESVRSDVTTVAQLFGEGVAKDLRADLASIQAPVTVVVAGDPADSHGELEVRWRAQLAAIPTVDLTFMPASHFVMYDQPEAFDALVDRVVATARRLAQ